PVFVSFVTSAPIRDILSFVSPRPRHPTAAFFPYTTLFRSTGFDAPTCSYIYLDNELRDHNLFQAICRTNRLDPPDKEYGYIVDFQQLLSSVQEVISVYTSDEIDQEDGGENGNNVELKDWLEEGKKQLD